MKNTSAAITEIRCNTTKSFIRLGDRWYRYDLPSGVLGEMLMTSSMGKYYNSFVKGNFNECRIRDGRSMSRTRTLFKSE